MGKTMACKGFINISETGLLLTLLLIGLIVAFASMRNSAVSEFGDLAESIAAIDQSYTVSGQEGGSLSIEGYSFGDAVDAGANDGTSILTTAPSNEDPPEDPVQVFIPNGIQFDVPLSTITDDWGWEVVYNGLFNQSATIATVFAGIQPGDWVMYAARPVGSPNITLFAAAPLSDVQTQTPLNGTTPSNGAEWYYNGYSIGFAGPGDIIRQTSADIEDSSNDSFSGINGNLRMSWHTSGGSGNPPTNINGGWRVGTSTSLNGSTTWERLILKVTPPPP